MSYRSRCASLGIAALAVASGLVLLACNFNAAGLPTDDCGDGVLGAGEECDLNDLGGESCDSLGYGTGTLACDTSCAFVFSGCSAAPVCGDSILDSGEECDDGNTTACDGCSASCTIETCGDGVLECAEQCDDGNTDAGDGCDQLCRIEVPPGCGDGTLDAGEECDDGNNTPCDGCSPACLSEGCGNGTLECGEECDDGNTDPCDGCSATCTNEGCGNGTLECGEECDDGNTDPCDGCSATCTNEGCGNGTLECGELCEAGQVGSTCVAEGFQGGTLGCNGACDGYDTSGCLRFDGAPCTLANQCVGGVCYFEADGFPQGYCTSSCVNDGSCTDGVCRDTGTGLYCYRTCTTSASCRTGYYCRIDPWDYTDLVCRPLCTSNAECPITGSCNPYTGRCNSPSSGAGNGAQCSVGNDCLGGCWLTPPAPSSGYCVSECNMSNPSCPGDGVCSEIFGPEQGDRGYCLDGCQNSSECPRVGFTCQSNPFGNDDVCWN